MRNEREETSTDSSVERMNYATQIERIALEAMSQIASLAIHAATEKKDKKKCD